MSTYFIATRHESYREREFEHGSTVIDPFRYLRKQEGVELVQIGRNRPALISLLLPSRGRPDWFRRLLASALHTAVHPRQVEVVAYVDNDDPELFNYGSLHGQLPQLRLLTGPRCLMSAAWNRCAAEAEGEIFMHCGDDVVFQTPGWDAVVRKEFAATEDKILFAYGDDLGPNGKVFGTHGFVHRRWVEAVGYFLPPLFSSDWNDVWLNEVAEAIGRKKLLPFVTEHMHYTFGKAERDRTHAEREERGERDNVVQVYRDSENLRRRDARKLRAVMK